MRQQRIGAVEDLQQEIIAYFRGSPDRRVADAFGNCLRTVAHDPQKFRQQFVEAGCRRAAEARRNEIRV